MVAAELAAVELVSSDQGRAHLPVACVLSWVAGLTDPLQQSDAHLSSNPLQGTVLESMACARA